MTAVVTLVIHETLCAAIFYSVFFRAVKTCGKVRADVRVSFFALGAVACAGMAAPLVWGYAADAFGLALLAAIAIVQVVTSRHWLAGVPDCFYRPGCAPRQRRKTDAKGRCTDVSC